MPLRIQLSGELRISARAGLIPAERLRRPAWVVLSYLVAERHRPVGCDELAEVLWGDALPRSWSVMVRGLVSKLRSAFAEVGAGREVVTTVFGCYQLKLPPDAEIDIETAEADVAVAEAALAGGEPARARATASRAAEVAGRRFLPGAEGFWVEQRQAGLAELRLRALEALAHAASACGDHATAVLAAEEVVALAPLRESGHLRLIAAHATAGNRAKALRAYETCRRTVIEELGVSPSSAVEAAYLELLDQPPVLRRTQRTGPPPLPAALASNDTVLLVGRQQELEHLCDRWKRATAGERQVVFVAGEAGIGKTRLAAEIARQAHADGGLVLYGRCDEDLAAPYEPLADVVRQGLTLWSGGDLIAHLNEDADELARLVPEFALQLTRVPRPAPDDRATARLRMAEAVDALLAALSDTAPLLVVLDDLHWAHEPAVGVLRRLVRSSAEAAVLLVVNYRNTELPPDHALSRLLSDAGRDPGVNRLRLGGIRPPEVRALIEGALNLAVGTDIALLAEALHAHTSGNPFFVGEVLRHLVAAAREGRPPELAELLDAVPENVRETITRRLLRLSGSTNELLTQAAVVGAEFDLALLEAMGTARDDVLDAVDEGVSSGFLVEGQPAGRYRFAHVLVRNTIYQQLGAVRRARLHHRVGQTMEHLYGPQGRHVSVLAHHFCNGATAGAVAKAAGYALAAAQAAAEQQAPEEAIAHLRAGLNALTTDRPEPEQRWRLLVALAIACGRAGDDDGRRQACDAAAEIVRQEGWTRRLAGVALVRSNTNPYNWRDPGAVALCEEALEVVGEHRPELRSKLLCSLLNVQRDRPAAEREQVIRLAMQLARDSGDANAVRFALIAWCIHLKVSAWHDAYAELRDAADELLALPVREPGAGDPVSPWLLPIRQQRRELGFRLDANLGLGDAKNVEADLVEIERNEGRAQPLLIAQAATYRSLIALCQGQLGEVEELCERARTAMRRTMGDEAAELTRLHHLFRLRLEQGRLAELEPDIVAALDLYPTCPTLRPMLALAAVELGRFRQGREVLEDLARDVRLEIGAVTPLWPPVVLLMAAELSAWLDDRQSAAIFLDRLLPHANVFTFPAWSISHLGSTDHFLGMLATVLEQWEDAEARFDDALRLQDAMDCRVLSARTQYWRARMLARRGRRGDVPRARTTLREVSAEAASLEAGGLGRHVSALLDQINR